MEVKLWCEAGSWAWLLGTWLNGNGGVRLMFRLKDLTGLFQMKLFYLILVISCIWHGKGISCSCWDEIRG